MQALSDAFNFAYMYCDCQVNYSAAEVIGHINQQLLGTRMPHRSQMQDLYIRHGHGKHALDLVAQTNLLWALLKGTRTIIVIDALDEMSAKGSCRMDVLRILQQACTENPSALSLLITARPLPLLLRLVPVGFAIEVQAVTEDLRRYVMDGFSRGVRVTSPRLLAEMCSELIEKSEGMYV
jgi:hypothetical protein